MKLVQKMSVGLSFACVMMLSSCSKESAQMPEPESAINSSSSLRSNLKPVFLPYFAPTVGLTGQNVFPQNWSQFLSASQNPYWIPAGTSSLQYPFNYPETWGGSPVDPSQGSPLAPIPGFPNDTTVLSSLGYVTDDAKGFQYTGVKTTITQLTPGKDYEITFYVSSGTMTSGFIYASGANFSIDGIAVPIAQDVLLGAGPSATQWVKKTVQFKAASSLVIFKFWPKKPDIKKDYVAVNLFVGKSAIKQLN